jgi:hypothetical protein
MHVRFVGIGLHSGAKLLNRRAMVFQLVEGFAGEHIGLGGLGIQRQYFVISIKHALVLFGSQAAMREAQPQFQVLGILGCSFLQVTHSRGVLAQPIVSHSQQDVQPLGIS